MKTVSRSSESGVALITVMIAIFVLSVLVGAFAFSMKVETKLAMNATHETQWLWDGRTLMSKAQEKLMGGPSKCPYDALDAKWAGGPGSECETNNFSENDFEMNHVPLNPM